MAIHQLLKMPLIESNPVLAPSLLQRQIHVMSKVANGPLNPMLPYRSCYVAGPEIILS